MSIAIHCSDIKLVQISELKEHPKNRNSHPENQIERLAKLLEYQGWRYPVKVSTRSGFITSGHGRVMAARHLGLEEVPVSYQDYDSDEQEYADIIADNAIASWSDLDLSGINLDLPNLGPDFDLDMLGIDGFSLDMADKNIQNTSAELNLNSFDNFQHECPKCGFSWNDNGTTA